MVEPAHFNVFTVKDSRAFDEATDILSDCIDLT